MDAENKYKGVKDTRKLVTDTTKYPFKAVAYVETNFFSDNSELGGTGFLCQDNIFLTVAHNVRDPDFVEDAARTVKIFFGLNGEDDQSNKKIITLKGSDFTVPRKYKKKTDECDIAWVDLNQYYQETIESGHQISWDLSDLPNEYFYTCSIPEEHGTLDEKISICGEYINLNRCKKKLIYHIITIFRM